MVVTQEGVQPQLAVSATEIAAAVEGGEVKFNITANIDWKITCNNDKFKVEPESGSGDAEIKVTYPANETPEPVSATLTVSAQNISTAIEYTVEINQPAGGGAKVDVLTPNSLGIPNGGYFTDATGSGGFAASYSGSLRVGYSLFEFVKKDPFGSEKYGMYSSKSGGKVRKISVVWDLFQQFVGSADLLIFCSNEPFNSVDEFHAKGLEPTGTVSTEQTVFEVQGDYKYVAIRGRDAKENYISTIEITWE